MLAGLTGSEGAVTHAEELLATASASRGASASLTARRPSDLGCATTAAVGYPHP